jgi:hypothetical protein
MYFIIKLKGFMIRLYKKAAKYFIDIYRLIVYDKVDGYIHINIKNTSGGVTWHFAIRAAGNL